MRQDKWEKDQQACGQPAIPGSDIVPDLPPTAVVPSMFSSLRLSSIGGVLTTSDMDMTLSAGLSNSGLSSELVVTQVDELSLNVLPNSGTLSTVLPFHNPQAETNLALLVDALPTSFVMPNLDNGRDIDEPPGSVCSEFADFPC